MKVIEAVHVANAFENCSEDLLKELAVPFECLRLNLERTCSLVEVDANDLVVLIREDNARFHFYQNDVHVFSCRVGKDSLPDDVWGGYLSTVNGFDLRAARMGFEAADKLRRKAHERVIDHLVQSFPSDRIEFSVGGFCKESRLRDVLSSFIKIWREVALYNDVEAKRAARPETFFADELNETSPHP